MNKKVSVIKKSSLLIEKLNNLLIEIFCSVHDFIKKLEKEEEINFNSRMHISEVMTIVIYYQFARYKDFKSYYMLEVERIMHKDFLNLVSYSRFIELMQETKDYMERYLQFIISKSEKTGTYFTDSASLPVCNNKRIYSHKVFSDEANRGVTSMGWFFGYKLHIVINNVNQLMSYSITSGNKSDLSVLEETSQFLQGKIVGDKGYISSDKKQSLSNRGLKLITRDKKNSKIKNTFLKEDLDLLNSRNIIESDIGKMKCSMNLDHSRHRSKNNFLVNVFSTLIAYSFYDFLFML